MATVTLPTQVNWYGNFATFNPTPEPPKYTEAEFNYAVKTILSSNSFGSTAVITDRGNPSMVPPPLPLSDWKAIRQRASQLMATGRTSWDSMIGAPWLDDGGPCLAYFAARERGELHMAFGHCSPLGEEIYRSMMHTVRYMHARNGNPIDTIDRIIANLEEHETPPTIEPTPEEEPKPEVAEPEAILV